MVDRSQQPDGRGDVDGRDDKLLNAEAHKLDAFHNVELGGPIGSVGRVATVRKDDCWDVQGAGIEYDHGEHISKGSLIADNKVKPRVQNEGLT